MSRRKEELFPAVGDDSLTMLALNGIPNSFNVGSNLVKLFSLASEELFVYRIYITMTLAP